MALRSEDLVAQCKSLSLSRRQRDLRPLLARVRSTTRHIQDSSSSPSAATAKQTMSIEDPSSSPPPPAHNQVHVGPDPAGGLRGPPLCHGCRRVLGHPCCLVHPPSCKLPRCLAKHRHQAPALSATLRVGPRASMPHVAREDSSGRFGEVREYEGKGAPTPSPFFPCLDLGSPYSSIFSSFSACRRGSGLS
jgi:hypothetical protein